MAADAKRRDPVSQEGEVQTDRRNFMKGAARAGLLGAAGAVSALGQPAQAAQQSTTADYRALWPRLGLGNWGWDLADAPPGGRVIHATVDKVHAFQGASRYTTSGEYINDSVEMDVITYKRGRWGVAGLFGYMTTHDRANDTAPL